MEGLRGRVALVTGSTGGLGVQISRRLASEGMNVVVSGRREEVLASLVTKLRTHGVSAEAVPADLADVGQVDALVERSEAALGPIDLLVNNAGVEHTAAFTSSSREELTSMIDVNLRAPMLLAHRVVPGMLSRARGHVVFVSSVAGKLGPACSEPYAATKAGLVGLTQSLRTEYLSSPVGFSVVCPGFIAGEGMYQRMVEMGFASNRLMGETTPDKVAAKIVEAIRHDRPEIVESGAPNPAHHGARPDRAPPRGTDRATFRRDQALPGSRAGARTGGLTTWRACRLVLLSACPRHDLSGGGQVRAGRLGISLRP